MTLPNLLWSEFIIICMASILSCPSLMYSTFSSIVRPDMVLPCYLVMTSSSPGSSCILFLRDSLTSLSTMNLSQYSCTDWCLPCLSFIKSLFTVHMDKMGSWLLSCVKLIFHSISSRIMRFLWDSCLSVPDPTQHAQKDMFLCPHPIIHRTVCRLVSSLCWSSHG